ncbi:MAG TPA: hypothetical protein VFV05_09490 [Methylomirabilota bacterium]|nr:hypothetical protein [Methylomirabilota bacterium]
MKNMSMLVIGAPKKRPGFPGSSDDDDDTGGIDKMAKRRALKDFAKAMAEGDWDMAGEAFTRAAEACGFTREDNPGNDDEKY